MECKGDPELIKHVLKLERSLKRMQDQRGIFSTNLDRLKREVENIKSKKIPSTRKSIRIIEDVIYELENFYNYKPDKKIKTSIYIPHYTIVLVRRSDFGTLTIDYDSGFVSISLSGILFTIINILLTKYLIDTNNINVPIGYQGAVSRSELDKQLYGPDTGKNKLKTHISRIRKLLLQKGFLDENFITSNEAFIRLNINGSDIQIIDMDKKA